MSAIGPLAPPLPNDQPVADSAVRIAASAPAVARNVTRVLSRLKWATILLPVLFIEVVHLAVVTAVEPALGSVAGRVLEAILVVIAGFAFSSVIFALLGRLQERVVRQNRELSALNAVSLEIASLQDLEHILRSVADEARELLAADAAILCLKRESGLVVAARSGAIAGTPNGDGNACPVAGGAACGSHLTALLRVGDQALGEICVLQSAARPFEARHQATLAGLADMAAIAIDNARLVERERYMAVLEERDRLAREMHDSLAQVLGYLQFKTRVAQKALSEQKPEKALGELDEMETLAGEAYDDVREAILGLRELHPDRELRTSVGEYLEKFTRQSGVRAVLEVEDGSRSAPLAPEAQVQLVRVIQEALTNVRKHARATHVWVRFGQENGSLRMTIEDDGCGFDAAVVAQRAGHRFGVWTMRERIEQLGGEFSINSAPGRGTAVQVRVPVRGEGE